MAKGKYQEWLTDEGLMKLEAWARNGLTDDQISKNMGINTATLYRYKQTHCEICNALKRGKEVVDIAVENALLKRALGYKFTEVTKERVYNDYNDCYEIRVTKEVTKEVQPDVTAQIFWLKNRKPEDWRDKRDIEMSGKIENQVKNMSEEELDREIQKLKSELGLNSDE